MHLDRCNDDLGSLTLDYSLRLFAPLRLCAFAFKSEILDDVSWRQDVKEERERSVLSLLVSSAPWRLNPLS
ncbi:hypothetical protein BE21_52950 [Sorangium cellulosum]|uniref:Uncharacterized protein n=1 Tax=Sorangium cellulosum TaxID=56 RepID=A0A150TEY5_SORCE|nr:hypothetical protein BE21_52950 [Sorangium cellulosum]